MVGGWRSAESDDAIQMREGTNYRVFNSVFQGFGNSGFCIRDAQSILNANNRLGGDATPSNTLSAEGLIMWSNGGVAGGTDSNYATCGGGSTVALNKGFFETAGFNNMLADPGFAASAFNAGTQASPPDFTLAAMPAGYTAFDISTVGFDGLDLVAPTDGRTLVDTDYAGAIAPGTAMTAAWYYGWTVWAPAGEDSRPNADGS